MASSTYDESLRRVLASEGGYTNDAADPGGPTNFGITIKDYRKYVKFDAKASDVRAMKLSDALEIYKRKYWLAMNCDKLPPGIDYCVFDYGVNSGIARAPKVLQRILGVTVDGHIGPKTLLAAEMADPVSVIDAMCAERLAYLKKLKTWKTFGKGWGARVPSVKIAARAMAVHADIQVAASKPIEPPPSPAAVAPVAPRPPVEPVEAEQPPPKGGFFARIFG